MADFLNEMERGYLADMTGPLIKRAVVGNSRKVLAENTNSKIELKCDIFYLDNAVHSGASGGPIVNHSGNVVGIITQRAMTDASQNDIPSLRVPSGSAVGISLEVLSMIDRLRSS
ncbi:serine protease [Klebsiella pneumoniae]|uniref:serine protease n=1 Tax=Klebsiella pneumoniae TaxID=573 RepID=UPI001C8EFC37|nr:serine protease [Klebsiella pneumoniae]MCA5498843.1 serine protease [Klebsiella pneumoniae]MCA5509687.1 serine protease [Klebsiella pneumoniae]